MGCFQRFFVSVIAIMMVGCASAPLSSPTSISVPYDPYDYDPRDLLAEAEAHCAAYNLSPRFEGETVDQTSVRWRYRHYRCE